MDTYVAGRVPSSKDTGSLWGDLMMVTQTMREHLTEEFLAMMSALIHAIRSDRELAELLWSHLVNGHSAARGRGAIEEFWPSAIRVLIPFAAVS